MRTKKIRIPIYPVILRIIEFEKDEELQNMFKNVHFLQDIRSFDGGVFEFEEKLYVCFRKMNKKGVKYPTPGIIVHESKHIVNEIYNRLNMELDPVNDEPEAYLLEWIFETISKFFE